MFDEISYLLKGDTSMEERRRNRRMELSSHIVIKSLTGEEEEAKQVVIEISDVSRTGIGFASTELLDIGSVYEAYLRIWTNEVLHAFLEIIRIEKDEEHEGVIQYGATFVGMPELDASRISIYDVINSYEKQKESEKTPQDMTEEK